MSVQHVCAAEQLQQTCAEEWYRKTKKGKKTFRNHQIRTCEIKQQQDNTTRRPESIDQDAPAQTTGPSGQCQERKSHNCECYRNHSPGLFAHTITPMSLTPNSCVLLPPVSQHSSAAMTHCQDGKAKSKLTHLFSQSKQTNKQLLCWRWLACRLRPL